MARLLRVNGRHRSAEHNQNRFSRFQLGDPRYPKWASRLEHVHLAQENVLQMARSFHNKPFLIGPRMSVRDGHQSSSTSLLNSTIQQYSLVFPPNSVAPGILKAQTTSLQSSPGRKARKNLCIWRDDGYTI